jgi:hypothetical protein
MFHLLPTQRVCLVVFQMNSLKKMSPQSQVTFCQVAECIRTKCKTLLSNCNTSLKNTTTLSPVLICLIYSRRKPGRQDGGLGPGWYPSYRSRCTHSSTERKPECKTCLQEDGSDHIWPNTWRRRLTPITRFYFGETFCICYQWQKPALSEHRLMHSLSIS